MGRHIDGDDRAQVVLFPERLDDWVEEDNPVRVVNAFIDALDLARLGFERAQPAEVPAVRVAHLKDKLAAVRAQAQKLAEIGSQLAAAPDRRVSLTDPDARSMATRGRGTGIVGYNVQTAVDTKHHLIVAHEVTNLGRDRAQLETMATRTRDVLDAVSRTVLTDRGYFSGEQILACEQAGITARVPKPLTSGGMADGRFDKRDEYRCPSGQGAIWRMSTVERGGMTLHRYWPSACGLSPLEGTRPFRLVDSHQAPGQDRQKEDA